MKKLLYINSHMSTGGSCEYTRKQIEDFRSRFDISLIETSYLGNFEVQRKQIQKMVDFYPVYGDQEKIWNIVKKVNPNIISFQEVPNSFINDRILNNIFKGSWSTTATAHSNVTRRKDFTFIPDCLITVNKWQQNLFEKEFKGLADVRLWEYPIEKMEIRLEQKLTERKKLGLDNGFHILNCGLFTKGKNQGEVFEIARHLPEVTFHFVGNQAGNFKDYWKPLMDNRPQNCIVHGERDDVSSFMIACDMFLFTSNYELWPLVLRQAISHNMPILCKKLPTYLDEYDNEALITYIDNDIKKTINLINDHITRNR